MLKVEEHVKYIDKFEVKYNDKFDLLFINLPVIESKFSPLFYKTNLKLADF